MSPIAKETILQVCMAVEKTRRMSMHGDSGDGAGRALASVNEGLTHKSQLTTDGPPPFIPAHR
jgi:hypothetical protein